MGCSLEHAVNCPAGERFFSRVSMSVLDQANNLRRLVVPNDDSDVSSSAYPYATLLGGIRKEILRGRLSLPLHQFESQSPQWGVCLTRVSRGEELHLYAVQVIKDLVSLSPSSLACRHFEGTDRSTARYKYSFRLPRKQNTSSTVHCRPTRRRCLRITAASCGPNVYTQLSTVRAETSM